MQIFIQHQGQQCGPFSLDQVRSGLSDGTYQLSELAWYEGASGWLPLSTVPGIGGTPPKIPDPSAARTSGLAVWSLVLGILAFLTAGLTAIPAVICGHLALGKIKRSAGAQSGGGLAIAGLVTGYLGLVIFVIAVLAGLATPIVIRQKRQADQKVAVSNARQIGLALSKFKEDTGATLTRPRRSLLAMRPRPNRSLVTLPMFAFANCSGPGLFNRKEYFTPTPKVFTNRTI